MDFCIADTPEELEQDKVFSQIGFFVRNVMTFINFKTFEEYYLTSLEYDYPRLRETSVFTLQPRGYAGTFSYLEDRVANLR